MLRDHSSFNMWHKSAFILVLTKLASLATLCKPRQSHSPCSLFSPQALYQNPAVRPVTVSPNYIPNLITSHHHLPSLSAPVSPLSVLSSSPFSTQHSKGSLKNVNQIMPFPLRKTNQ